MIAENAVQNRIQNIMSRVSRIDMQDLESEIRFREELGVDSLMAMEIIAVCEKELEIMLDESELGCIETIGDFVDYVSDIFSRTHEQDAQ
jgi:acyl carrier protein